MMRHQKIRVIENTAIAIMATVTSIVLLSLLLSVFFHSFRSASFEKMEWFLFSFFSGSSMFTLPFLLPLVFVAVPLAIGGNTRKSIGIILWFGFGMAATLSLCGVFLSLVGHIGYVFTGVAVNDIRPWVYFLTGTLAYIFALKDIGLLCFKTSSYTGSAPDFVLKSKDPLKVFSLGVFFGSVSIGYFHPATPLLLMEAASSGNVLYGGLLFFIHALGRVAPLLFLVLLGLFGVNSVRRIAEHKKKIARTAGWMMVFVAGFILAAGLLSLYYSGFRDNWSVYHVFGLAIPQGTWLVFLLWLIPLWWDYFHERHRVLGTPAMHLQKLQHAIDFLEAERRHIEALLHIPDGAQEKRIRHIEGEMDKMEKERRILEEAMRYGAKDGLRTAQAQQYEEEILRMRRNWYLSFSLFLLLVLAFLPFLSLSFYLTFSALG